MGENSSRHALKFYQFLTNLTNFNKCHLAIVLVGTKNEVELHFKPMGLCIVHPLNELWFGFAHERDGEYCLIGTK